MLKMDLGQGASDTVFALLITPEEKGDNHGCGATLVAGILFLFQLAIDIAVLHESPPAYFALRISACKDITRSGFHHLETRNIL